MILRRLQEPSARDSLSGRFALEQSQEIPKRTILPIQRRLAITSTSCELLSKEGTRLFNRTSRRSMQRTRRKQPCSCPALRRLHHPAPGRNQKCEPHHRSRIYSLTQRLSRQIISRTLDPQPLLRIARRNPTMKAEFSAQSRLPVQEMSLSNGTSDQSPSNCTSISTISSRRSTWISRSLRADSPRPPLQQQRRLSGSKSFHRHLSILPVIHPRLQCHHERANDRHRPSPPLTSAWAQ